MNKLIYLLRHNNYTLWFDIISLWLFNKEEFDTLYHGTVRFVGKIKNGWVHYGD